MKKYLKRYSNKLFKKADLSFNVIIVALIALIVLVIVISIFSSKTGSIDNSLNSCLTSGGFCVKKSNCDGSIVNNVVCSNTEQECCRGLARTKST